MGYFFTFHTMKLFKFENFKVIVEPEALLLKPFKDIWDRDPSEERDMAMKELAYIYFYADPRSDYMYLTDDKERSKAIIEGEAMKGWKVDKTIKAAIEFYKTFKSSSAMLLDDTKIMVDKLRKWLVDIDMTKTDSNGKPIYTINTITSTIKQIPSLIKEIHEVEKAMAADMAESGRKRGQGEKSIFDNGLEDL